MVYVENARDLWEELIKSSVNWWNTLERYNNGNLGYNSESKAVVNAAEKQSGSRNVDQGNWKPQGRGSGWRGQERGRNPNAGKQCFYCHKMNHTIDECYSKHGYPPWFKQR